MMHHRAITAIVPALLATMLTACGGSSGAPAPATNVNTQVRQLAQSQGLKGFPKLNEPNLTPQQSEIRELRRDLGRNLFFDHVMSGVKQTSCGTCHHAAFQFSDARNIARGVFCDLSPSHDRITCHDAPTPGEGGNVAGPDRA
jgi:cytochrome c peroxidase